MNRFDEILKPISDNHYSIWKDGVEVYTLNLGLQTDILFGYSWKDPLYRVGSVPPDIEEEMLQEEIIRLFNERRDDLRKKLDISFEKDEDICREEE